MQKMVTLLLALVVCNSVQAQSRDVQRYCFAIGEFARSIMQNRQAGTTQLDMMATKAPSPEFQELGETLIKAAFLEPIAESEELKQRAVNAFENATAAACNKTSASPTSP